MKVSGITNNNVVNLYSKYKKHIDKSEVVSNKDLVEISSVGKSLSSYSIDDKFVNSKEKIEELKKQVSNGTYNKDSKLVAEKIIQAMKNDID